MSWPAPATTASHASSVSSAKAAWSAPHRDLDRLAPDVAGGVDGGVVPKDLEGDVRPRGDVLDLAGTGGPVPAGAELLVVEHAGEGGHCGVEQHDAGDVARVLPDVQASGESGDAVTNKDDGLWHACGSQRAAKR